MTEDAKVAKGSTNENTSGKEDERAFLETLSITMDKRIDLALDVAIVLLGGFILVASRDVRLGLTPDPITSRGMPEIVGAFLVIAGIVLGAMRLRTWSALPGHLVLEEGKGDEEGHPASWVRAFGIILAAWLSVWLLKPLGFLIVTPLFLFAFLLIMGVRSWGKRIAFPTIYTLATWYIFSQLLKIILPLGPFAPLARSLGLMP